MGPLLCATPFLKGDIMKHKPSKIKAEAVALYSKLRDMGITHPVALSAVIDFCLCFLEPAPPADPEEPREP